MSLCDPVVSLRNVLVLEVGCTMSSVPIKVRSCEGELGDIILNSLLGHQLKGQKKNNFQFFDVQKNMLIRLFIFIFIYLLESNFVGV